jgi:hypothetical protein
MPNEIVKLADKCKLTDDKRWEGVFKMASVSGELVIVAV